LCKKPFAPDDTRVCNHSHLIGQYRGPAHSNCNLNYRDSHYIPVVFHNFSFYDAHFIIKEIVAAYKDRVDLLPITKQKYISFTKHVDSTKIDKKNCVKLWFIDSFRFFVSGLDKLASFLSKNKLQILQHEFSNLSEENFNLLTQKDVFPYEYIDCIRKVGGAVFIASRFTIHTVERTWYLRTITRTPSICGNGSPSRHSVNIATYVKTDVSLLADVFENFRDSCVMSYGLDPAYYYTLLDFTWNAMLKHMGVRFELLTDIDMVMFIKRGICGGLNQCSNRYARANDKYRRTIHRNHTCTMTSTICMAGNVSIIALRRFLMDRRHTKF